MNKDTKRIKIFIPDEGTICLPESCGGLIVPGMELESDRVMNTNNKYRIGDE
jgi:hypothetical protein